MFDACRLKRMLQSEFPAFKLIKMNFIPIHPKLLSPSYGFQGPNQASRHFKIEAVMGSSHIE